MNCVQSFTHPYTLAQRPIQLLFPEYFKLLGFLTWFGVSVQAVYSQSILIGVLYPVTGCLHFSVVWT